jgi:foldase protein PrsA
MVGAKEKIVKMLLTSGAVFWLVCISTPTTIQARFAINDSEQQSLSPTGCYNRITKEEMEFLLKDANPIILKRLAEDTELKKQQIKNIKELLAVACQAVKEGFADDNKIKQELDNIEIETTAVNYDGEINTYKSPLSSFSNIDKTLIDEFYADKGNLTDFENFLKIKIQLAKDNGQIKTEVGEDIIEQAKDYFAKTRIYYNEAQKKATELSKEFWDKTAISIKLRKASYLSRFYSQKILAEKTVVTEVEIQDYISKHPEFDTKTRNAKADKILQRVKAGENFAKLAKEFSEDPGSQIQGGLYRRISAGQFIPEFEKAALSLKAGQVYPQIVESKYGFHIIKLVRKSDIKDADGKTDLKYDVRHILVSTQIEDPDQPFSGKTPLKEFVKNKLETAKQKNLLDKILAENPVEIDESFEVPENSDETVQKTITPKPTINGVDEGSGRGNGEGSGNSDKVDPVKINSQIVIKNLPPKIKLFLNSNYKGWKSSASEKACGKITNNGVIEGDFNGDKKSDYAMKFIRAGKGYIIAFLAQNQNYKAFILQATTAGKVDYANLDIWKKGELVQKKGKSFRLKNDAPGNFNCETDVGGVYYYQNDKFVNY